MAHTHPHSRPRPSAPGRAQFTEVRPILNVADLRASLAYYEKQLGFDLCWAWSNEQHFDHPAAPTFAEVKRGHVVIGLGQRTQGGPGMWIYTTLADVADLEALRREYAQSGARIVAPPEDLPWGMREMLVQDLDGHTFRIGAPLEQH